MAEFEWVETFISLEGEHKFQGFPTVYVRFSRCNFKCQGFNNPDNVKITNEVLGFDPRQYDNIKDLPVISIGCDSLYAHDKRFDHMWKRGDENVLAQELVSLLPTGNWIHPVTKHPYILSLTGGEPTLRQKTIPSLLNHPLLQDLEMVLIETNGAVPLSDAFISELNQWIRDGDKFSPLSYRSKRRIIWSNSPKLSVSGEEWDKAICPEIVRQQLNVSRCEQYFKFVCGPSDEDFDEVERAMEQYHKVGIPIHNLVGIMPVACTTEQQNDIAQQVAEMCIKRGYMFNYRLQNALWGNEVGT